MRKYIDLIPILIVKSKKTNLNGLMKKKRKERNGAPPGFVSKHEIRIPSQQRRRRRWYNQLEFEWKSFLPFIFSPSSSFAYLHSLVTLFKHKWLRYVDTKYEISIAAKKCFTINNSILFFPPWFLGSNDDWHFLAQSLHPTYYDNGHCFLIQWTNPMVLWHRNWTELNTR